MIFKKLIDQILLRMLLFQKKRQLQDVDMQKPIELMKKYRAKRECNPEYIKNIVEEILNKPFNQDGLSRWSSGRETLMQQLAEKEKAFEDKPFQLGALDLEMDFIEAVISQYEQPKILEIGIANGYSSACIYGLLDKIGGRIISIDMPRFEQNVGRSARFRKRLVQRGIIKNTGTLGDLNPGGVIPEGKYSGWLIPMELRLRVPHIAIFGNAFDVLKDLTDERFNVAVLDAMKGYKDRIRMFRLIAQRLYPGGICFIDGYWVNTAFTDFCKESAYGSWSVGRVGVYRKPDV